MVKNENLCILAYFRVLLDKMDSDEECFKKFSMLDMNLKEILATDPFR